MKNRTKLTRMTLAAFFLALAYVLPFLTGQIPEIGAMLCPMHIPVLLAGFICGGPWGLAVGFLAPLSRSFILGMPPLFPKAICMAFELAVYGLAAGVFYKLFPRKKGYTYAALILAMILGRIVWGAAMYLCMGISGEGFTFAAFLAGAVMQSIPGIILQLVLVPAIVFAVDRNVFYGGK